MEGYEVVVLEDVVGEADLFVTTTGNKDVITAKHMASMKHNAIVGNIGHFDNEIDMAGLESTAGVERINIKPQVDEWKFADGHSIIVLAEGRLLNLGCATGHPSFVMSASFTNQVLAQIELHDNAEKYDRTSVVTLPKNLDERVARLHLGQLGAKLTTRMRGLKAALSMIALRLRSAYSALSAPTRSSSLVSAVKLLTVAMPPNEFASRALRSPTWALTSA